jgi:hypothetical protein
VARFTVSEVRLSPRAALARSQLETKQRRKLDWWISRLKLDPFAGDRIPKARIPSSLAKRSGFPKPLANAWRFELPLAFRGIYTVSGHPAAGVAVIILEILPHKEYEHLFGYR